MDTTPVSKKGTCDTGTPKRTISALQVPLFDTEVVSVYGLRALGGVAFKESLQVPCCPREREFFIDNLLVRIHFNVSKEKIYSRVNTTP